MSFQELQAKFRRQYQESPVWKLLRADNSPLILAFISDLFRESNEVPFGKARAALEAELDRCRELDIWITETPASTYLREWILSGWLRELDDLLTKTDACEIALRFCHNLEQRETNATASHLRIVQEAVRDLAVAMSPNPNERVLLLKSKQAEIQLEIDKLTAGIVVHLTPEEQKERLREIYQLASVLTGDFRRVEDEIREMDKNLRVSMIKSGSNRGEILQSVLEREQILSVTDAGRAFEGFFQLLCDQNRSTEFREQLKSILGRSIVNSLSPAQTRFLGQLMRELGSESERVLTVRRRTEESLRTYIENETHLEMRAIDRLLEQLKFIAVSFHQEGISLKTELPIELSTGSVRITSPESMKLREIDEQFNTGNISAHPNLGTPSNEMLECLDAVKVSEVALRIKNILAANGPLTIAGVVKEAPLTEGLEELVACLRVARAVDAIDVGDKEFVEVLDKKGNFLQASIPKYLFRVELFPDDIEDLVI